MSAIEHATVELTSETEEVSGTSKNTGKPFSFKKQIGYIQLDDKYREKCTFMCLNGITRPAGMYVVDPRKSFSIDNYGSLGVARDPVLVPLK